MGAEVGVPQVGALVEVTLIGEVTGTRAGDGFWLRVRNGLASTDHWLPVSAAVKTLRPYRPSEVLLLECGHVTDEPRPSTTSGTVYCWRSPCHARKSVVSVSSVSW